MKEKVNMIFESEIFRQNNFTFIIKIQFKTEFFRETVVLKKLFAGWNNMDIRILRTNEDLQQIKDSLIKNKNVDVEIIYSQEKKTNTKFNLLKRRMIRTDYDPIDTASLFRPKGEKLPKKQIH